MKESFFQFSDPQLTHLNFTINENFSEELFDGFSLKSDVSRSVLEEDKKFLVSLKLEVGEVTEKQPFNITIEMSAYFMCKKPEGINKLLQTNAPALLLSYARPIISLITSQAGYPSFNIPFMNFVED